MHVAFLGGKCDFDCVACSVTRCAVFTPQAGSRLTVTPPMQALAKTTSAADTSPETTGRTRRSLTNPIGVLRHRIYKRSSRTEVLTLSPTPGDDVTTPVKSKKPSRHSSVSVGYANTDDLLRSLSRSSARESSRSGIPNPDDTSVMFSNPLRDETGSGAQVGNEIVRGVHLGEEDNAPPVVHGEWFQCKMGSGPLKKSKRRYVVCDASNRQISFHEQTQRRIGGPLVVIRFDDLGVWVKSLAVLDDVLCYGYTQHTAKHLV